ncbi:MAG: outer membrane beta-barrel protein, partial [Cytophagales bacterium]|nr:outer membrane beta-barrel protein [Cytophagales bacterium]
LDASHPTLALPVLTLREETQLLKEVTVVTKKPFIEQQVDRTVVNVENSIVASGNTALEVLEKAPGVTIDRQNDQIILRGKQGVIVLIDGKQTYLSAQEVSNLLKNTPSDNIEKIEIITNPSSKYDAAGNSGIINIKMKKNQSLGTNGTLIAGAGYGRYEKANGSLRLNHRAGKLNAFGNYSFNYRKSFQENEINRIMPQPDGSISYFDQASRRPNWFNGHNYRAGLDYFASKKSTFGVLVTGFSNDFNQDNALNKTIISNQAGDITQKANTWVTVNNLWTNVTGNLNYKYDLNGQGREFTADLDYSRFDGSSYNYLLTRYFDAGDEEFRPADETQNRMPSAIDIWAFKADYVHPTKKGKLEAGVKSSYVQSDNNLMYDNRQDAEWVRVDSSSNHFNYHENINAAFGNYSTALDKKTKLQVGLRVEHTRSEGVSETVGTANKGVFREYVNLFPTVFLSRQLDTNHVLNFSYSRRIDRPNYQDLNPFIFYLDRYTYQQGNPYLRPQYTNAFQVTHVYKGAFSTSLGYSRTTDVIVREVPGQVEERNETFVMANNLNNQDNVNLTLSFPVPIRKWWTIQNNVTVLYNQYNTVYLDEVYKVDVVSWNAYMANNFVLGKGFTGELAGWYNSAGLYGFFRSRPMGGFSLGVQKQVLHKKGNVKLNVNDPLWLNRFRGRTDFEQINFRIHSRWESRVARVTFTYNFGNQQVKAARQRTTGTEAERNRAGSGNN